MIIVSLLVFTLYLVLFLASHRLRDHSWVDVMWPVSFLLHMWGVLWWYSPDNLSTTHLLLLFFVSIWWVRLATHIMTRKAIHTGEDSRYSAFRRSWGEGFYGQIRSLLQIYLLQYLLSLWASVGIWMIWISSDHILSTLMSEWTSILVVIGVFLIMVGLFFEIVWDAQLARYLAMTDRAPLMMSGLYRYTRHPNYFGESCFWFGVACLIISYSLWGFVSWMLVTFLLIGVSGIPMQERRYIGRDGFSEYRARTSAFFPWFPKA